MSAISLAISTGVNTPENASAKRLLTRKKQGAIKFPEPMKVTGVFGRTMLEIETAQKNLPLGKVGKTLKRALCATSHSEREEAAKEILSLDMPRYFENWIDMKAGLVAILSENFPEEALVELIDENNNLDERHRFRTLNVLAPLVAELINDPSLPISANALNMLRVVFEKQGISYEGYRDTFCELEKYQKMFLRMNDDTLEEPLRRTITPHIIFFLGEIYPHLKPDTQMKLRWDVKVLQTQDEDRRHKVFQQVSFDAFWDKIAKADSKPKEVMVPAA